MEGSSSFLPTILFPHFNTTKTGSLNKTNTKFTQETKWKNCNLQIAISIFSTVASMKQKSDYRDMRESELSSYGRGKWQLLFFQVSSQFPWDVRNNSY